MPDLPMASAAAEANALFWIKRQSPGAFRHFVQVHKRTPDLKPPQSNQAKILWRKLFDHNPLFTTFNDKLAAKAYAKRLLPNLRSPATYWSGTSPDDLPGRFLEERVMIKANHGWNFNIFPTDARADRSEIEAKLQSWLAAPFGVKTGQWGYYDIPRRIYVEQYLEGADGSAPEMYNVHVMGGTPRFVGVYLGPKTGERMLSFFTPDARRLPLHMIGGPEPVPQDWRASTAFFDAVDAATVLGKGVDYVRCDFLAVDGAIWFSELTTYPSDAGGRFDDQALADKLHRPWDLRQSWFLSTPQTSWRELYRHALRQRLNEPFDT